MISHFEKVLAIGIVTTFVSVLMGIMLIYLVWKKYKKNRTADQHPEEGRSLIPKTSDQELAEDIKSSYLKALHEISLDPSNPDITVETDNFYLDLELQDINDKTHRVKDIKAYMDIFQRPESCQNDSPHRIALYAPAGSGKTVLCQVVAYRWAKCGELGNQFDLVIYLKLRGYSKKDDLAKMFINQNLSWKRDKEKEIRELIRERPDRILYILDGYDEMIELDDSSVTNIYTLADLLNDPRQNILISTRPTQLGEMKRQAKLNKKVRIKGFAEKEAECFIENYCSERDIVYLVDESVAIKVIIMKQLKEKRLLSLSKNPQQLQLVCDYMRDNKETSGSLTRLYDHFYDKNRDTFLIRISKDPKCDQELLEDLQQSHLILFRNLQHLALCGFIQGKLIYNADVYVSLLGERYVTVFDKLGAVYFELAVGKDNVWLMGFRHKSYQEYFAAKILYYYLIENVGSELPNEVAEALNQWKSIDKAVRYERLFVFMAGMAKEEESARKVMGHILDMVEQLPQYFLSDAATDVLDPDDVPRQLILMQVKCALEIRAVNENSNSDYITELLDSVAYTDMPLPDVNTEEAIWKEDDDDDFILDKNTDTESVALKRIPPNRKPENVGNGPSITGIQTAAINTDGPNESTLEKPLVSKNGSTISESNVGISRAFWFRLLRSENKCDVRIDCLVVHKTMLSAQYPPLNQERQCFFALTISHGLQHVLTTYTIVDVFAVDCSMTDVFNMKTTIKQYTLHHINCSIQTSGNFLVHLEPKSESEFINCHNEPERVLSTIVDTKYQPNEEIHLQYCDCSKLEQHAHFLNYLTNHTGTDDVTPLVQRLVMECCEGALTDLTKGHLSNAGISIDEMPNDSRQTMRWEDMVLPTFSVTAVKTCQFTVGRVSGLCLNHKGDITICEMDGNMHRMKTYGQTEQALSATSLPSGCSTRSITRHEDNVLVADRRFDCLHVVDHNGSAIGNIPLPFNPWYITSTGRFVWATCDVYGQVNRLTIANDHTIKENKIVTLENYEDDAYSIAVSNTRIALCHKDINKVNVYDHSGKLVFIYGSAAGLDIGQLNKPSDVCLSENNYLYIADLNNRRVVIVDPDGETAGYIHIGNTPYRVDISKTVLAVAGGKRGSWEAHKYTLNWENTQSL